MIVVVFRYRLKPEANLEELDSLYQRMHGIVTEMPGFISVKDFMAPDGEGVTIVEFASLDALNAWRDHPEHLLAQRRGREDFFADYRIAVCELIRVSELGSHTGGGIRLLCV